MFKIKDVNVLDLRGYSRNSDKLLTIIQISDRYDFKDWIKLGEIQLIKNDRLNSWCLESYLLNATDFEHDSAKCISLELIGLDFKFTNYGHSYFEAWIAGDNDATFLVPDGTYNPLLKSVKCKDCKNKHAIVEQYLPPYNPVLWSSVRGVKISIRTGVSYE